jgi:TonB family protein
VRPWVVSVGIHAALAGILFTLRVAEPAPRFPVRVSHVVALTASIPTKSAASHVNARRPLPRRFQAPVVKTTLPPVAAPVVALMLEVPQRTIPVPALPLPSPLPPPPLKTDNLAPILVNPLPLGTQTLQATGFSAATSEGKPKSSARAVSAGFGDVALATSISSPQPRRTAVLREALPETTKPVEILVKPRPAYTDEARRLQLEGEVLLEILFAASGSTRVIRVLRGLGHGLDENAIAAAAAIRYRPAERAGAPVDTAATVHIVFQLAY